MTRLIASEFLKLRTTRTFYVLVIIALALVVLPTIPISAFAHFDNDQKTARPRPCCTSSAGCPVVRARTRHPGGDDASSATGRSRRACSSCPTASA